MFMTLDISIDDKADESLLDRSLNRILFSLKKRIALLLLTGQLSYITVILIW